MLAHSYLAILSMGLIAASAMATTPPPTYPFKGTLPWPHRSTHRPATDFILGRFHVRLERTTLGII